MKKLNSKGFTLIELLAVIVILAILITISVPAVTKYLSGARKDTYVTNAQAAISAVRNERIATGAEGDANYTLTQINGYFESGKTLKESPYGADFAASSYIHVDYDNTTGTSTYSICLVDSNGAGIPITSEASLTSSLVQPNGITCTVPTT